MTITFTGDKFEAGERVLTNCHSLDWALEDQQGHRGIPSGIIVEVYGPKNVGKSSLCFSLMGMTASALGKSIVLLDWEGQNRETVESILSHAGFEGTVDYVLNKPTETSEETISRFVLKLYDIEHPTTNQPIGLIDSVGAFRPTANMEGDLSDANMGAFARETGRYHDWLLSALHRAENKGIIFTTNHLHPKIGFRVSGQDTAGGVKHTYLTHVRFDLNRAFLKNKDGTDGGTTLDFGESWLMKGHVDSSRIGYSKRDFYVYMVAGEGIHLGLTAMWDCILDGSAELSAKKVTEATTITMDGQAFGKLGTIIRNRHEKEQFIPFMNKLKELDTVSVVPVEEETPKKGKKK